MGYSGAKISLPWLPAHAHTSALPMRVGISHRARIMGTCLSGCPALVAASARLRGMHELPCVVARCSFDSCKRAPKVVPNRSATCEASYRCTLTHNDAMLTLV